MVRVNTRRKKRLTTAANLCIGANCEADAPSQGWTLANAVKQGDEWGTYIGLGRVMTTYRGIAYSPRGPRRRSRHSSRRRNDRPWSVGKLRTGQRAAGDSDCHQEREVCQEQNAETLLSIIRERGKRGLPLKQVYPLMYNPHLYLRAYARLYANKRAMTRGASRETVDGMSRMKIDRLIDALRHERFRWTLVRRVHIPKKKNGKLRPLGLPTWTGKLLQEVMRSILDAYFEPQFSVHAHGFRSNRGCHTALSGVQRGWTGVKWFIEGDVKGCFDNISHEVLLRILGDKIHDNRFLQLVRQLLQAGYLEDWRYGATLSGTPQGGVPSPLLSNAYLNELDQFVEQELLPAYNRGTRRREHPQYKVLLQRAQRLRRRGRKDTAKRKPERAVPWRVS